MPTPIQPGHGINRDILALLAQNPDGLWPGQLIAQLGRSPRNVTVATERLTKHGYLSVGSENDSRGKAHQVVTMTPKGALALLEARRSDDVHSTVHS